MRRLLTAIILCLCVPSFAQAPLPESLLQEKVAYVKNDGARAKDFDSFYNELKKWGRFKLVQERAEADIAITLSTRSGDVAVVGSGGFIAGGSSSKYYIRITRTLDDTPLWSDATGDWLISPKHLVSNLKKRMQPKNQ